MAFSPESFARLCVGLNHKRDDIIAEIEKLYKLTNRSAVRLVDEAVVHNAARLDREAVESEHYTD